jgi:Na+-translocating ferredoxin:NAD+ oxidoreductase RnfC subunit
MSDAEIVLRIDATEGPKVQVGDKVRQGQPVAAGGAEADATAAPVSGTVTRIDFDAPAHEFVIVIQPEDEPGTTP